MSGRYILDEGFINAARNGDFKAMQNFIEAGADVNAYGGEVLVCVAKFGSLPMARYVVSEGVDIAPQATEALCVACENGNLEMVKYLVGELGIRADIGHNAAFLEACENGHLEVVKYLVAEGVDVYYPLGAPLSWASYYGHLEVVKYLISQGVDMHGRDEKPTIVAHQQGHQDVLDFLIARSRWQDKVSLNETRLERLANDRGYPELVQKIERFLEEQALALRESQMRAAALQTTAKQFKIIKKNRQP